MRHARPAALEELADLIDELRRLPGLVERSPGIFYRSSRAFLHFHDDESGLYADLRLEKDADFSRFRVSTAEERRELLRLIAKALQAR